MNKTNITKYIAVLIVIALGVASALTRPSPAPNNNNVFPLIDSLALQQVKGGTGAEGGIGVDMFSVAQAARFDGMVYINSFLSGPSVDAPNINIGTTGTRSRLLAEGNIEAGSYLQADNLINNSMRRVCRDRDGFLVLCAPAQTPVDRCPNIEGIQPTVDTALFEVDGSGNCVKPGPPPPPPPTTPTPTIEVRYIPVASNKRFTFLSSTFEQFLRRTNHSWMAPVMRIDFGTPLTQEVRFHTGYCTNHGISDPMPFCRGIPLTMDSQLVGPDRAMPPWPNALINPSTWSGEAPACSFTAQWRGCPVGARGPRNPADFGRREVVIPAGTRIYEWTPHSNEGWTDNQRWKPPFPNRTNISYDSYYSSYVPRGRHPNPDMTNVYFFNISDPSNVFNLTNLTNLTAPKYQLNWVTNRTY